MLGGGRPQLREKYRTLDMRFSLLSLNGFPLPQKTVVVSVFWSVLIHRRQQPDNDKRGAIK